jgi:enamine deaminase RidA (YjgF/YER057c/UK114 family)
MKGREAVMERHRNWPDACWQFDFEVPMSLSDRYGRMISIAGSVALDAHGQQRAPGDLRAQTDMVAREVRLTVEGAGAGIEAIAKLVVFHVGQGPAVRDAMLKQLRGGLPGCRDAVITAVPVANLAFPGMMIEVEGFAFADGDAALPRHAPGAGIVSVEGMTFIGGTAAAAHTGDDLEAQASAALSALRDGLHRAGSDLAEVARLNVYYQSRGGMADLDTVGWVLAQGFQAPGPVVSFVPLPVLAEPGCRVMLDAIAMKGKKEVLDNPPRDWPASWPFSQAVAIGDLIFVGGQPAFDQDRAVLETGDMAAQTRLAMDRIVALLEHFGAGINETMKVGCW